MSAGLLALFCVDSTGSGFADKNWLNTPDKIWSRSPDANSRVSVCFFKRETPLFLCAILTVWLVKSVQGRFGAGKKGDAAGREMFGIGGGAQSCHFFTWLLDLVKTQTKKHKNA